MFAITAQATQLPNNKNPIIFGRKRKNLELLQFIVYNIQFSSKIARHILPTAVQQITSRFSGLKNKIFIITWLELERGLAVWL